eukprot:TRINITY_DN2035_c0_g1_i9.p1 TRINITY_DN2035_c0_g1~~TRINITY_DN2035_c0_g1_i9.p1  ORF type:complete len:133 (-),score=46.39 TRINITY_DN2035_c0_g1_i9:1224-1622(-)
MISRNEAISVEAKKWKTIYPAYLNIKFSAQQGRRVPKSKAVEDPKISEISEVLQFFKIPHVIEMDKAYSRDWLTKGRIKVQILQENGTPTNPEVKNKKLLLSKLGELIPRLKSRTAPQQSASQTTGGKKKKH